MIKQTLFLLTFFISFQVNSQYREDSIKLKDGFLHFYTKGEGRPVVLLQGGPGFSSYYMRSIADSLSGYKCILIDYEGTGKSQYRTPDKTWVSPEKVIADIELVRKKLNIEIWDIIGHSYGTHFGLYYAINYPQRVDKIILVSSIGTNNLFQRYANDNAMVRLTPEDITQLNTIDSDSSLNSVEKEFKLESILLKSYFFDKKKIEPFLNSVPLTEKQTYFNNNFFNAYFDNPNFWKWDISEKAYQLMKPIRIIQGRQDFLTDGNQELMNLRLKDSKIYFIERSGHFPWIEKPSDFFALLRKELVE
ncbi:alpha/beta hydrolase [Flavobacterium sp.]|uniref:alpha/beta fold hydrolase n=1 Tax=Flavobacterium sp. TaxID=239 RepID=UPI002B4AEAF9|nr:alpha/beta hydrolase [Flavobacterium sp.]HLP63127.1 alpha/beta hydrolase [Flavobacterium sp.]